MAQRVPFPFGPFTKGCVDGANLALDVRGLARRLRGFYADGIGRLRVAPGTKLALSLQDDGAPAAGVTSVVALAEFGDGALAVGHSTVTQKFYLYRLDSLLTGYYDAAGTFHLGPNCAPVGVLWAAAPNPAKVLIAEGLGQAFIAHNEAASQFQTRLYTVASGLSDLLANLRGSGNEVCYFRGVVSFQQHLWGWGFGSLAAGENDRPDLLRFSYPSFSPTGGSYFSQTDSFTIGHRTQSARERVAGAVVAGQYLYVGTNFSLWPITGYGRNTWDKSRPASSSYGLVGPFAGCPAGPDEAFYWSPRGPLVASGYDATPLWDALPETIAGIVNPQDIVCVPDLDRDQVLVFYRGPSSGGVRLVAAFDIRRRVFFGPDRDVLLNVGCGAYVTVPTVGGGVAVGPSAAPNTLSTTGVGNSVATANWVAGDTSPGVTTIIEYKRTVDPAWTVAAEVDVSVTSYQLTGLAPGTAYEWRAKHRRNGQDSAYAGPVAGSEFSTIAALLPPSGCAAQPMPDGDLSGSYHVHVTWTNSGEAGVSTEVHLAGPLGAPPASGTLPLEITVGPGVSSYDSPTVASGDYYAEVRHVKSGYDPSAYSNMASATVP